MAGLNVDDFPHAEGSVMKEETTRRTDLQTRYNASPLNVYGERLLHSAGARM